MEDPRIEQISPHIVCLDSLPATLTIRGSSLHPVAHNLLGEPEVVLPTVSLIRIRTAEGGPVTPMEIHELPDSLTEGADPEAEPPVRWISEEVMLVDLTPSLGLRPGVYSITIRNPDASYTTDTEALLLHSSPMTRLTDYDIDNDGVERHLRIDVHGGPFFLTDFSDPMISFEGADWSYPARHASGCTTLTVQARSIETCSELTFRLPGTVIDETVTRTSHFAVSSFEQDGCAGRSNGPLDMPPCPQFTSVHPRIACACEEERRFTITGTTLVFSEQPRVQVNDSILEVESTDGCTDLGPVMDCSSLSFIHPQLVAEDFDERTLRLVGLTVPPHCIDPSTTITLAPHPRIGNDEVDLEEDDHPPSLLINGGFVYYGPELPLVSFNDEDPVPVDAVYNCDYLPSLGGVAQLCLVVMITVPEHLIVADRTFPFRITNPDPVGCTSTTMNYIHILRASP